MRKPGHLEGYAKAKGISRQAARKLLNRVGIDYLHPFSHEEADQKIAAQRDPKRDPYRKAQLIQSLSSNPPTEYEFAKERAKREYFEAEKARLSYEEMVGRLVDVAKVEKEGFRIGRIIRDSILAIPDRLAGLLAAETDQHKVHAMMLKELTRALEELPKGNE